MDIAVAVTAIGTIIFLAHLFAAFFEQSRVPDVLPLVLIGLFIGPITGLATIQHFGEVGPVFSNLTLVIILFESGLNMKLTSLRKALAPAAILGFVGYILSVIVVVGTSKFLFKLPDTSALILGTILGGTAASIAVPLLKGLNLQERTRTALVLESVLGNVLSIVVTIALMTAVERDQFRPTMVLRDIAASFTMACVIGAIFGYMWSSLLVRIRTLSHTKFTTPACVCISYGFAEMFGFSGMLAALAFGIVMGNAERLPHSKLSSSTWLRPISLNDDERALFAELVFLLKTFFFVYLGISIQAIGMDIVYAGSIIVIWLFISRPLIVRLALPKMKTTKVDATIACIMIPRGLAAAVLASIAVSKGIEDAIILQSVAYSVVILSIANTALFSFFCERRLLTQPYKFIFTGYKDDPVAPPGDSAQSESLDRVETDSVLHYQKDYHKHSKTVKKKEEKESTEKEAAPKEKTSQKAASVESAPKEAAQKKEPTKEKEKEKDKEKEEQADTVVSNSKQKKLQKVSPIQKNEAESDKSEVAQSSQDSKETGSNQAKKKTRKRSKSTRGRTKSKAKETSENPTMKAEDKDQEVDLKAKEERAKKKASFEEQTITTSSVSLSHTIGPGANETTTIVTAHHEIEEKNGNEEKASDDTASDEQDKVES